MKKYEEKRKGRLEEAKVKDPKESEIHKATTIYHGVTTDYGVNKGFVEHPSYMRQKEHECFIPKKWMHTWVGHNKGV